MRRAYILLLSLILLIFVSFVVVFNIDKSSYLPKYLKNTFLYIQAKSLAKDSVELAKYFLYEAKRMNLECLDTVELNYPSKDDVILLQYFYPLRECKNNKFTYTNQDANLSKDNIIVVNISVLLKPILGVNEEVFVNKKAFLYPNKDF